MNDRPPLFVNECSFCGNGLLRLARCSSCEATVALCDECELIWRDIPSLFHDNRLPSDGAHPNCPVCRTSAGQWSFPDQEEIHTSGLDAFVKGESV